MACMRASRLVMSKPWMWISRGTGLTPASAAAAVSPLLRGKGAGGGLHTLAVITLLVVSSSDDALGEGVGRMVDRHQVHTSQDCRFWQYTMS